MPAVYDGAAGWWGLKMRRSQGSQRSSTRTRATGPWVSAGGLQLARRRWDWRSCDISTRGTPLCKCTMYIYMHPLPGHGLR